MTKKEESRLSLQADFNKGFSVALDPTNDESIRQGGEATTTYTSYWLTRPCPVCQHTFRVGDAVFIDSDKTVRHRDGMIICKENEEKTFPASKTSTDFFKGLDEAWPPPEDIPIVRLEAGHRLLAEPSKQFQRHKCAVCGHTFRLHDQVVICPCSPNDPLCQIAIHRDPIHGLLCFSAWNPGANKQKYCPVTSRKLNE